MVNETLVYNLTEGIGEAFKNVIGVGTFEQGGLIIIGVMILLFFMIWLFKSGAGLWGLIVIMPVLIVVLSRESYGFGFLPEWFGVIIFIMLGIVYGLIILRVFREA